MASKQKVATPRTPKKLPAGLVLTPDMSSDQRLDAIAQKKTELLEKKTRKQQLEEWANGEFAEEMRDFFIDFHLEKGKAKKDFKVSTEFKKKLDVPNPQIDDLRRQVQELKDKIKEADDTTHTVRANIADVCEIEVDDLDGALGEAINAQIAKGPPKAKRQQGFVSQSELAKGWTVMYTQGEGKPYYVHVMRQLSQWDPPQDPEDADPPSPPPTPDPPFQDLDYGWWVKYRERDSWEKFVETRTWQRGIPGGVPTRAQKIQQLFDLMRDEEVQEKATSEVYAAKREHRHEQEERQRKIDKGEINEDDEKEEGGEGDGEGDKKEEEEEESDPEPELWEKEDKYEGDRPDHVFGDKIVAMIGGKLAKKSCRVKFEYPLGCTPDPSPTPEPEQADGAGGSDGGGDFSDSDTGDFSD